jgi:predicted membrane channel-forming protein YqfA (hemolysin III family)
MENHKTSLVVTLVLGTISVLYLIVVVLSLLDIYQHREPDLSEEWGVVVFGLFLFVVFSSSAIFTTIRLLRQNTKLS